MMSCWRVAFVLVLLCRCASPTVGQTGIPLGVELTGAYAIPTNDVGVAACGRLWLDGTNLFFRFGTTVGLTPIEVRGPAAPRSDGPLLHVLDPVVGFLSAYSDCDAAAGVPPAPPAPWQDPPPPRRTAEGRISIQPEQIPDLLSGVWFASSTYELRPRRGHRDDPGTNVAVRGPIVPLDTDSDGVPDYLDDCPGTPPGALVNGRGCNLDQVCPCDAPWKSHGAFVNCMREAVQQFVGEGVLTEAQAAEIFHNVTASDCGKRKRLVREVSKSPSGPP